MMQYKVTFLKHRLKIKLFTMIVMDKQQEHFFFQIDQIHGGSNRGYTAPHCKVGTDTNNTEGDDNVFHLKYLF